MKTKLFKIAAAGIFAAISVILAGLIHIPLFPAVAFLEYDPADIPIIIVTAAFGFPYGIAMTAAVAIIQGLTVSASSGWIGIVMHFVATGSFVTAFSAVLKAFGFRSKIIRSENTSKKYLLALIIGSLVGTVTWTVMMALWNAVLTPYFMHMKLSDILPLYPFIIAFNLIKSTLNGAIACILMLPLKKVLKEYSL